MRRKITHSLWTLFLAVFALVITVSFASAYLKADKTAIGPGDTPDYLTSPNWAYSPPLRKFMDNLPGLTAAAANSIGQYLPVAVPDMQTYPGSDYYEIELVQYQEQMHTDLQPTTLRGYRQINDGIDAAGNVTITDKTAHHLGPVIVAQKNRPVRVKFINNLPTGVGGNLFIPVDESVMGAGDYDIDYDPKTKTPYASGTPNTTGKFSQNRGLLHLHGGRTPWISDGTPHQWITPAGETNAYKQGVSVVNVPDMDDPGPGAQTYYWTNQQSARLMFYHDHSWGITRLNVYVGEAAGYIIQDQTELDLVTAGILPADVIPLVIEDKTFVDPATIKQTDPTWIWGTQPWIGTGPMTPVQGDLWWPHVYMPAQNPFDPTGIAPMGRWAYGPYFWPATNNPFQPIANPYYSALCDPAAPGDPLITPGSMGGFCQPPEMPSTPNPSWGAEAFMDTPTVNGTAYPIVNVEPKAYRLRILNAAHDRFYNLSIFKADTLRDANTDPTSAAQCLALGGCAQNSEVVMVDSSASAIPRDGAVAKPTTWPEDGREGGVPDWSMAGPKWVMVGAEGGFLPRPVVIPPHPVSWNVDVTTFNAGNVNGGSLILAPAERADVVVDFSQYAGQTLILYNDAPAPWPALDPHYDYYTDDPDRQDMGGAPPTVAGIGPNVRTVMQIVVAASPVAPAFDMTALNNAFIPADGVTDGVFAKGQDPLIVGQGDMNVAGDPALYSAFLHDGVDFNAYNEVYHKTFPDAYPNWGVAQINDREIHFSGSDGSTQFNLNNADTTPAPWDPAGTTLTGGVYLQPKAIQDEQGETFDAYGRMRAALGLTSSQPGAGVVNFTVQTFSDPATEIIGQDEIQIWKITHNGVDTHPIHFHLFDVQVLDRVGWDGFMRLPDPTEFGWKDTVRISPLEDTIVAVKPVTPSLPFGVPESYRPLNPARPMGDTTELSLTDPATGQAWATANLNRMVNNDWEYVWHCHILSHEENDMMRTIQFKFQESLPVAPYNFTATSVLNSGIVDLTWTDPTPMPLDLTDLANPVMANPTNEVVFQIERSVNGGAYQPLAVTLANATSYTDTTATDLAATYRYRIYGANATNQVGNALTPGFVSNVAAYPPIPVEIADPFDGTNYLAPANVTLTINAQSGVTSVEIFNGATSLGLATGSTSPFSFAMANLTPGSYALTAKGTDTSVTPNVVHTSDLVNITVNPSAPIADFSFIGSAAGAVAGAAVNICETVSFDGSASTHSNPDYPGVLTYAWDFGGATATGVTVPNYAFGAYVGGTYPVSLIVTDDIGQSSVALVKNVTRINHAPLADANPTGTPAGTIGSYMVATGASLTLNATASDSDTCDITPLTYSWDLNGDATPEISGLVDAVTGIPDFTQTFAQLQALGIGPGDHTAILTVTDGGGVSTTAFANIMVENPINITSPAPGAATVLATPSQTFTWPSGTATLYQLLVGTTPGGFEILVSPGINPAVAPATDTTYTVTSGLPVDGSPVYVRLSSKINGIWSSNDYVYSAYAPLPVASFTFTGSQAVQPQVDIGYCEIVNFDGSTSVGNATTGVIASYSWDINGDGVEDYAGLNPGHLFAGGAGTHPVTLTVTDTIGQTASVTQNVVTVNHAPVANANTSVPFVAYSIIPTGSVTFNGLGVDPDVCDLAPLTYDWDLNNDGVYETTGQNPTVDYATLTTTLGVVPGVQTVALRVTGSGGLSGMNTAQLTVYDPATGASLTASPAGSQVVGTPVLLTAGVTAGSGTYEYKFWINDGSGWVDQPWSTSNTYNWDTTGLTAGGYIFAVYIRNLGSSANVESFITLNYTLNQFGPATGATLAASPTGSQVVGSPVTLTATGSGGSGTYEYKFWINSGGIWTNYGWTPTNTFNWDTTGLSAGTYTFAIYVRNAGSTSNVEAFTTLSYTLDQFGPATSATLAASPIGSQVVGSPVTLTAGGAGGSGTYEYKFWINSGGVWTDYGWSSANTFNWDTTGLSVGSYSIAVYVRNAGSSAAYEAWNILNYQLQ